MSLPSKSKRSELAAHVYEQRLDAELFEERLCAGRTPEQDAERLALMNWFRRRYPTPLSRLRYCSRQSRLWRTMSDKAGM